MPSVVCPLPTAYSPQDALKAYLDAKKQMPGLTPAAWRKAAAQSMGIDYDTYLALWKVHKGVASRLKMIPESKPTVPAAQSSAPNMGFAEKAVSPNAKNLEAMTAELDKLDGWAEKGLISLDELPSLVSQTLAKHKLGPSGLSLSGKATLSKKADDILSKWKPKTATAESVADAVEDVIDALPTKYGPLTHDLAQSVYKKMKKEMPTATPAAWRHAAAQYLEVDYNDYLKAWKKPTTAAQKAATTPASKLPPSTNTPLSPSPVGKYATKDITPEELKDELAKAYGPGAKKEYINFTYLDHVNTYQVQFPSSLLHTQAAKDAAADALKKLGLEVAKDGSYYYIKSQVAKKLAQTNVKQIKQTGTYTLPDGTKVLDITEGDKWTNRWWADLSYQERAAWHRYTSSGYTDMNNYLRKGTYLDDSGKMAIREVTRSMQTVEHQITVFRGSPYPPISHFKVGNLWQDKGFMSTAVNPGSAWGGVKYVVTLPKGSRGMYIGKKSSHPHENEFLIDKGTQFRVTKVEGNTVYLTAIPKKKV